MSSRKDGKTKENHEVGRLLELVSTISRIDEKVTMITEQLKEIKETVQLNQARVDTLEKFGAQTIRDQLVDIRKKADEDCQEFKVLSVRVVALEDRNKIRDAEIAKEKDKAQKKQQKIRAYGSLTGIVSAIIAILTYLSSHGFHF
jgi:hypothetical protein